MKEEQIQKYCQLLLRQGLIDQKNLYKAYQYYLLCLLEASQAHYSIEQEQFQFTLAGQSNVFNQIEISRQENYVGKWIPYASNKLALFDENCQFLGVESRHEKPELYLAPIGGISWIKNQAYHINSMLHHSIPLDDIKQGPIDLFIPGQSHEMLFFTDRAAGMLYVTDQTLTQFKARINLRKPGSKKAFNIAYSSRFKCCFMTDHQTPDLIKLNMTERKQERFYKDYGILGNLVLHDETDRLYTILADPEKEPAILIFSLSKLEHLGTILLPGKRFSDLDDPCDLIALSDNGQRLLVMSYSDKPALVTPIISIIDTQTHQLLDSYELKKEDKPVGIGFSKPSIKKKKAPDFEELLLKKGWLSSEKVQKMNDDLNRINKPQEQTLDKDVIEASKRIEASYSAEELDEVINMSEQAVAEMLEDAVFEWSGREDMTPEDKASLLEKMATIAPSKEVSQTNGVFVLNWLKGLLR